MTPRTFLLPALLAASTVLTAHAANHARETTDPYTHLRTITLDVEAGHCSAPTTDDEQSAHVRLTFQAVEEADGVVDYNLLLDITNNHLIHLGAHPTLDVAADGKTFQFRPVAPKTRGSDRNGFTGRRRVYEGVLFGVDRGFLSALSTAKTMQFRMNAEGATLERCTYLPEYRDVTTLLDQSASF